MMVSFIFVAPCTPAITAPLENIAIRAQIPRLVAILVAVGVVMMVSFNFVAPSTPAITAPLENVIMKQTVRIKATILDAVGMRKMIAFGRATDGTLPVSSRSECKALAAQAAAPTEKGNKHIELADEAHAHKAQIVARDWFLLVSAGDPVAVLIRAIIAILRPFLQLIIVRPAISIITTICAPYAVDAVFRPRGARLVFAT
jgi:hypothetical protein